MKSHSLIVAVSLLAVLAAGSGVRAETERPGVAPAPAFAAFPYRPELGVPPGYHLEARRRKGLLWTGAAMFAVSYTSALVVAGNPDGNRAWNLIPVAGPWLYLQHLHCTADVCDDMFTPILAVTTSVAQAVSLALLAKAYFFPRQWIVTDQRHAAASRRTIAWLPRVDRLGASLFLLGTF